MSRTRSVSLELTHPLLFNELNHEINKKLHLDVISRGLRKDVWWKCKYGHEWNMSPHARTIQKQGCPYCSGRRTGQGNSLQDVNPDIAATWHLTKNGKLTPNDFTSGSGKKVWWMCSSGHEWEASISSRQRSSCPFCTGRVAFIENNITVTHPNLMKEWNYSKNINIDPVNIVLGSHKHVWWKCKHGHEWKSKVYSRTRLKSGCPRCSARLQTSRFELRVYSELLGVFGTAFHCEKINGKEADIFLPNLKIAIEVDGSHWHKQKEDKDKEKIETFKQMGITTIRMREFPLTKLSEQDVIYYYSSETSLSAIIELIETIGRLCNIDCSNYRKTGHFINDSVYLECVQNMVVKVGNSFAEKFPQLISFWHPVKNGILTPYRVSYGSKFNAWWKCDKGHEWQRKINYCSSKGNNICPYCSGRRK